ncbi:hypothetical protein [Flavobacterium johnsoniae]|jgi:hypothetical protein|uniref:Uncharacterized protein n=1 Tax=Flavobacterium johnsoniae TaxID=986 RepID=A0A1J7BZG7_FLAJO|nr:hypothetical protein [Flavobacterium johnsoniae]OIV44014.1 hypothetical protein BKM63_02120 [Flavobacterium johnsoniae]
MISLNMVWPAIYVYDEIWRFWFLVFVTIIIETFTIMAMLKYSLKKAIIASVVGNLISGLVGTFVMMWAMLFWHLVADNFVPHATFDIINWVATYILMCLGSVFLEVLTIKLIFNDTIKKLFIPLLIGNLLTYGFIAYSMISNSREDDKEKRVEQIFYSPTPNNFILLDSTKLQIFTAKTEISYDENDNMVHTNYPLEVLFKKEKPENFQFELRLLGEEYSGGIESERKIIELDNLSDTIHVILEQKNPDPNKGWTAPIITDTIKFIKRTNK